MRVELRDVTKSFGAVTALRRVSFTLESGERVALLGPNGSGKSTLTRSLLGMLDCRGEILLDGLSPVADRARVAPRIAYVPQIAPRLAAPVREIVAAVARLRGLTRSAIEEIAAALELDLSACAARPFRSLSGGMRQKLGIALALASRPSLLLLDEPTASLDPRARQRFFELMETLAEKPTVLLASHRLDEIRHLVTRVLVLEDGVLTYDGSSRDYLGDHAQGVIEVLVDDEEVARWLAVHGFHCTGSGWWMRTVKNGQRLDLVQDLTTHLRHAVRDLVVRDVESIRIAKHDAKKEPTP
ncbi:MAG: ABC transporter ATP-binding protein [Planctomycetes bacterium]|nr:ABC transporter ATP-binding protein [Planctomycetota bacterium]